MRTCTTMIYTDGTKSRFAVMRGKMRGKYFNAHTAEIVATYETAATGNVDAMVTLEKKLTSQYATEKAPAVYWQA